MICTMQPVIFKYVLRYYMHSVLIRNGPIRNTGEFFGFLKKRLKSTLLEMIQNICGSLDVNTKYFFLRICLFFLTKYRVTSYAYLIGEKIGQYFAQKTMILFCKGSKLKGLHISLVSSTTSTVHHL